MKPIGTIEVKESRDETIHYECAAWYKLVRLVPGIYNVYQEDFMGRPVYRASIPATVISDNFQSLLCGVPVGKKYDPAQNAGQSYEYMTGECPDNNYWFEIWARRWGFKRSE